MAPTVVATGDADDLDDGLDYSFEAVSDDEQNHLPTEDQLQEPEIDSDVEVDDNKPKKRKKGKSEKLSIKKKQKTEEMAMQKTQVSQYSPQLLADFVAGKLRQKNKDLSSLELNDLTIPQNQFVDTTSFDKDRELDNFDSFIRDQFKEDDLKSTEHYVLVLSMSAIRVCDVTRALRKVPGGSIKLIKKNSVDHDKKALKTRKGSVVVSTAGRVNRLMKDKVFDKSKIKAIVVDSTYLDPKTHNIWDHDDTIPTLRDLSTSSSASIYLY